MKNNAEKGLKHPKPHARVSGNTHSISLSINMKKAVSNETAFYIQFQN